MLTCALSHHARTFKVVTKRSIQALIEAFDPRAWPKLIRDGLKSDLTRVIEFVAGAHSLSRSLLG